MNDAEIIEINNKIESLDERYSRFTYLSFGRYQITWTVKVAIL